MATWHQMQARKRKGFRLFHDTKWTVLTDPPGGMAGMMLFGTEQAAKEYLDNLKAAGKGQHSYILRPASEVQS